MALFKKNPPAACPKCGKADGWRVLTAEASQDYVNQGSAVNSFSSAPIRNLSLRQLWIRKSLLTKPVMARPLKAC